MSAASAPQPCTGTVDVHAHFVPQQLPDMRRTESARWPTVQHRPDGAADVVVSERTFRTIPAESWNVERRLEHMEEKGLSLQVLSAMPLLLAYWAPCDDAVYFLRGVNEAQSEMVRESGGRLAGLGVVPLQDPDRAAGELQRIKELGLLGVMIGSNVNGLSLGDARFQEFFSEVARHDLAVFVHAHEPAATDGLAGPPILQNLVGFPVDIGLAVASLITSDLLRSVPSLRIGFSHGGGSITAILPRLVHGWSIFGELGNLVGSPGDVVQRMWFDTLTYDERSLRFLIDLVGSSSVVVGTDYPFVVQDENPVATIGAVCSDQDELTMLSSANARAFFALR